MLPLKYFRVKHCVSFRIHEIWGNLAWETKFFGRFSWFWMHVFMLGVFFIAGFFHLDMKAIIARAENCKISYQTFLKVGRNWENNNCLFLPFFRLLENEKLKKTQFLAIFRKVWVEDIQFSVLTTITSMSTNWRNPSKKQELWEKMGIFGVNIC